MRQRLWRSLKPDERIADRPRPRSKSSDNSAELLIDFNWVTVGIYRLVIGDRLPSLRLSRLGFVLMGRGFPTKSGADHFDDVFVLPNLAGPA